MIDELRSFADRRGVWRRHFRFADSLLLLSQSTSNDFIQKQREREREREKSLNRKRDEHHFSFIPHPTRSISVSILLLSRSEEINPNDDQWSEMFGRTVHRVNCREHTDLSAQRRAKPRSLIDHDAMNAQIRE